MSNPLLKYMLDLLTNPVDEIRLSTILKDSSHDSLSQGRVGQIKYHLMSNNKSDMTWTLLDNDDALPVNYRIQIQERENKWVCHLTPRLLTNLLNTELSLFSEWLLTMCAAYATTAYPDMNWCKKFLEIHNSSDSPGWQREALIIALAHWRKVISIPVLEQRRYIRKNLNWTHPELKQCKFSSVLLPTKVMQYSHIEGHQYHILIAKSQYFKFNSNGWRHFPFLIINNVKYPMGYYLHSEIGRASCRERV